MTPDIFTTIDRLRLPPGYTPTPEQSTPRSKPSKSHWIAGPFLKGPIPMNWLSVAAKLRGKAPLAVALALWFEAGAVEGGAVDQRRVESLLGEPEGEVHRPGRSGESGFDPGVPGSPKEPGGYDHRHAGREGSRW